MLDQLAVFYPENVDGDQRLGPGSFFGQLQPFKAFIGLLLAVLLVMTGGPKHKYHIGIDRRAKRFARPAKIRFKPGPTSCHNRGRSAVKLP